jgi:hypothetical protein
MPRQQAKKADTMKSTTKRSEKKRSKTQTPADVPKGVKRTNKKAKENNIEISPKTKRTTLSTAEMRKINALVNKYTKYTQSDVYKAELFVRKYLKKANKNVLIHIISVDVPAYYSIGYLQYKTVECELFKRTEKPCYPPRSQFSAKDYEWICRAIDWDTAQTDIKAQKKQQITGEKYKISGELYLNRSPRPPYFIKSAPDKIKALANDLDDHSSPLWDKAYQYFNADYLNYEEFLYKIRKIEKIN